MELVLLIGIPGSGKSTFCRRQFYESHLRLNLDMLRTRHREWLLYQACLQGGTAVVVDNTNVSVLARARFIVPAREAGYRVLGYYFRSHLAECLARNAQRHGPARIPDAGVRGMSSRLELPTPAEGFDQLFYVTQLPEEQFQVEAWRDEE